jgi:hypothetical protein
MTNNCANKTSFKKGDKRRATGVSGRRAGVPNRLNAQCKEMIATCFENIGGIDGLVAWAKKNRTAFYTRMDIRLLSVNVTVRDHKNKDDHKNVVYESLADVRAAFAMHGVALESLEKLKRLERIRPIEQRAVDGTPRNGNGREAD